MSSRKSASTGRPPAAGKGGSGAPETTTDEEEFKPAKPPPKPKTEPKYYVHSRKFIDGFIIVCALFTLGVSRWFRPGFWSTIIYALIGLPIGIGFSFLFYLRSKNKAKLTQLWNVSPGAKGLEALVGRVPSWVSVTHSEKCEWLNKILEEMWPFYDYAVCEMLKEQVQPIFDSLTPPGMDLSFAKLQFGDAPLRVEAVRMDRKRYDGVYLEFDVRWAGAPEVKLKAGVPGAQLQPKVDHIRAVATVGVHLKPLVNEVPAFGAAIITLIKPPKLSYNIDIGAIGGKVAGGGVEQFLDNLIPGIIEGFLVWPERIVVPILGEDVTGPLTDLMLRHKGIIKVAVLEARDIPRMDRMGTSDPSVTVFTDPHRKVSTATKKNTLNPKWDNEEFYLMVQEPESQYMRLQMFDRDMINVKQALKINFVKGVANTFNSKESMCKGNVFLRDVVVDKPGEEVERWFSMGTDDWSADDGPGRDAGELKLRMTYVPLQRCNPMVGDYGAFFVYVRKGRDFPRMIPEVEHSCNPYYIGKVGDKVEQGMPCNNTTEPDWGNASLSYYDVPNSQEIRIDFKNKQSGIGVPLTGNNDEDLGYVTIDINEVRHSKYRHQRGSHHQEYELQDADSGYVTIECLFVAYF